MKKINLIFIVFSILFLTNCSIWTKKTKEETTESARVEELKTKKKRFEPDLKKRSEEALKKGGGSIFGRKQEDQFGNRNVMWVASLEVLREMPILFASYSGSIISTDWYQPAKSKESMKVSVEFTNNKVSVNSIRVKGFVKSCSVNQSCEIKDASDDFNKQIKDLIIDKTRQLEISKIQ